MTATPKPPAYLHTGQQASYDHEGQVLASEDPVQDGSHAPGRRVEGLRFTVQDGLVQDRLTNLCWPQDLEALPFPMAFSETDAALAQWNLAGHQEGHQKGHKGGHLGRSDWRVPSRWELRTLVDHSQHTPCLPAGHPFQGLQPVWYWSATPWVGGGRWPWEQSEHAMSSDGEDQRDRWRLQVSGGRLFFGHQREDSMLLPVCGPASGSGAAAQVPAEVPRFTEEAGGVLDRETGLLWDRDAGGMRMTTWKMALSLAHARREATGEPWRLPTINELETLVDATQAYPALSGGHPFTRVADACWSGTTSGMDPAWAYCLYLGKGAVGVGYKPHPEFCVWLVR